MPARDALKRDHPDVVALAYPCQKMLRLLLANTAEILRVPYSVYIN